jgi:amino acid transporter
MLIKLFNSIKKALFIVIICILLLIIVLCFKYEFKANEIIIRIFSLKFVIAYLLICIVCYNLFVEKKQKEQSQFDYSKEYEIKKRYSDDELERLEVEAQYAIEAEDHYNNHKNYRECQ